MPPDDRTRGARHTALKPLSQMVWRRGVDHPHIQGVGQSTTPMVIPPTAMPRRLLTYCHGTGYRP